MTDYRRMVHDGLGFFLEVMVIVCIAAIGFGVGGSLAWALSGRPEVAIIGATIGELFILSMLVGGVR